MKQLNGLDRRIAIAAGLLVAAPAAALDQNSLRLTRTGPTAVRLSWQDADPTGFCVLRDATPPPVTKLAATMEIDYDDTEAAGDFLLYGVAEPGDGSCGGDCRDNGACPPDQFCHQPVGGCGDLGACTVRPTGCPAVWDPVCGCDGKTYGNECEAGAAGQSVAYRGECVVTGCIDSGDCAAGEYCQKAVGDCAGTGACVPQPAVCLAVWIPVCGCDGRTYSNAGCAAVAGVSVDHDGEC